jgi:hypothetical protein
LGNIMRVAAVRARCGAEKILSENPLSENPMSTIDIREPSLPATGEDVREPPLPSNNGSKDDLPSEEEKIDPADGGGRAPRRAAAAQLRP